MAKKKWKVRTHEVLLSDSGRYGICEVDSLAEYIVATTEIYEAWDDKKGFFPDPWYRGVSDSMRHRLLPGYYRLHKRLRFIDEDDYREEFNRRSPPLLDGRLPSNNWEAYFLMQHYGLPTRLLDWSEGSLIALFFAVEDFVSLKKPIADAAVWMLDPWFLNSWSIGKKEVLAYDQRQAKRYLCKKPFARDRWPKKPVALMPTYNSRRLAAQRGMFTIHGRKRKPLEEMIPKAGKAIPRLIKIHIRQWHIEDIQYELRGTGVTDVVLFPELPSLSLDMRRSWERT